MKLTYQIRKEVFREIQFLCKDGRLRTLGTLKQVYSQGKSDFYFFPSLQQDELNSSPVEHVSFHFSGQSHVKRINQEKEIISNKNTSICQNELGAFIFFSALCHYEILPIVNSLPNTGDIIFTIPEDCRYIWCELSFVSSEYLLNNNLGFGLTLSCQEFCRTLVKKYSFAAGNPETNQNMMMQLAFGKVDSILKPKKLEFRTFKTQKIKICIAT